MQFNKITYCLSFWIIFQFLHCGAIAQNPYNPPEVFNLGALTPVSIFIGDTFISPGIPGLTFASQYATGLVNANNTLLPRTRLTVTSRDTATLEPDTLAAVVSMLEEGVDAFVGPVFGVETEAAANALVGKVFNKFLMAQNGADSLNNKEIFDTLARIVPPVSAQAEAMFDFLAYLADQSAAVNIGNQYKGYLQVAVCGTATSYGISLASAVQDLFAASRNNNSRLAEAQVLTYQTVLSANQDNGLASDVDNQLQEIINSGARVIIYLGAGADIQNLLAHPLMEELVGPRRIWILADQASRPSSYLNLTNVRERFPVMPEFKNLTNGFFGISNPLPRGPAYAAYVDAFEAFFEPIAPSLRVDANSPRFVDAIMATAHALDRVIKAEEEITPNNLREALLDVSFEGVTGIISFGDNYDLTPAYDIVNSYPFGFRDPCLSCLDLSDNNYWIKVAEWTASGNISLIENPAGFANISTPLRFFDGTTDFPNLDVRDPISYWSCKDATDKTDFTGLIVQLETPDYDYPDDIASTYICDQFIDCNNMSDEGFDCTPSFAIAYTIVAAITLILIVFKLLMLVPFVIVFGYCLPRRRVQAASPLFLLLIVFSAIVGLISTFAWYGKPHTAACIFRVWLLAPAAVSMAAALFAKTFRIWRIFRNIASLNRISDWETLLLWALLMLPVVLLAIGWTAFSTPMGGMEKVDGVNHYLCSTGGLTNEPGGLVWFSLIVAYGALLIILGIVLIFLIRKVPAEFNETRILAVSVYNFAFLCIVVIPVYFVLINVSPFAAWLILILAVLYLFTATIVIQFVPMIVYLLLHKCSNKSLDKDSLSGSSGTNTGTFGTRANNKSDSSGSGTIAPV